jgi:hypothetical protein
MLSDEALNRLVQPIIDRQQNINTYVIRQIALRIKEVGEVLPSDVQKLISLRNAGGDAQKIMNEIARLTQMQVVEIQKLVETVAKDAYVSAKPFYDFTKKPYIPYDKNTLLKRRVQAMAVQTSNSYKNLTKAQAFMIRDPKNPKKLIPTSIAKTYQSIMDEAVQAASGGTVSYNTAMRKTIKQLADSGLRRVEYETESGRQFTQRTDTAVRRNLLDGMRAVNQEMQNIVGEQFGSSGVEITVHMNPAPDHAEMQGHQFTNKEFDKMQHGEDFKDIQGRTYQGFDRAVGTLNCRHFAISIMVGITKPNYTDEQLKEILKKNEEGYTLPNGKHLTMYECTQRQRQLETQIRYAKDGQITAKEAGNMELAREYQRKIDRLTSDYKQFSKACGLSEKKTKMSVPGYRKISLR